MAHVVRRIVRGGRLHEAGAVQDRNPEHEGGEKLKPSGNRDGTCGCGSAYVVMHETYSLWSEKKIRECKRAV